MLCLCCSWYHYVIMKNFEMMVSKVTLLLHYGVMVASFFSPLMKNWCFWSILTWYVESAWMLSKIDLILVDFSAESARISWKYLSLLIFGWILHYLMTSNSKGRKKKDGRRRRKKRGKLRWWKDKRTKEKTVIVILNQWREHCFCFCFACYSLHPSTAFVVCYYIHRVE